MSKLILIASLFFVAFTMPAESIYTHSVTTMEGENKQLSTYQGKKLLIITLPIQMNIMNDSLLRSLDSIRAIYNPSLKIIGIPSYEDGYTTALKSSLTQWYRSILGSDIIITEGLYTRKTSGSLQHPLFKWLCDKEKNAHFNNDVAGPGHKFFVWTNGELVGVLGASTKLRSNTVHELLEGL
jgi:glutathione peroxidase